MAKKVKKSKKTTTIQVVEPGQEAKPNLLAGDVEYNSEGQLTALGAQQVIARGGSVLHKGKLITSPDHITVQSTPEEEEPTFGDDNLPLSHFEDMTDDEILEEVESKKVARKIRKALDARAEEAEAEEEVEEPSGSEGEGQAQE